MLAKTRGIVLHTRNYGDNSLILTVYTPDFGRMSCVVNMVRGMKAKNKAAIMQPLFLVEMEIYLRKTRELQRIKEIKLSLPYLSIPFDIKKSSQVLFLAEILDKILQEEESNQDLYSYIEKALVFFDTMTLGSVNFHIWFLARMTEYAGFQPHWGDIQEGWFDMQKGIIINYLPPHSFYMDQKTTACFKTISGVKINDLQSLRIEHPLRSTLAEKLLEFYQFHFESLGKIHSLDVLKEVYQR